MKTIKQKIAASDRRLMKAANSWTLPHMIPMQSDGRLVVVLAVKGKFALIDDIQNNERRRVALLALKIKN